MNLKRILKITESILTMHESNMFGIHRIELLTSKDYILCSMCLEVLIKSKHVFNVIEIDEPFKKKDDTVEALIR